MERKMKAVFFDFDGTLTTKSPNIWKAIWKECGYDTSKDSYYANLFKMFIDKKITHQQWCDLTCEKFREAGFNEEMLYKLAGNIKLIDGIDETLEVLNQYGYCMQIVSGNILPVIERALGRRVDYFESINANKMFFDKSGVISKIQGTNYDFEGKAKLIDKFKQQTKSAAEDLFFVGNSSNDEWAHESGCKTICINPEETDSTNTTKWHICKGDVQSLTEILPLINEDFDLEHNK